MQTLEGSMLDFSNKNNFKLIIINKAACFYILDVNLFSKGKKLHVMLIISIKLDL